MTDIPLDFYIGQLTAYLDLTKASKSYHEALERLAKAGLEANRATGD